MKQHNIQLKKYYDSGMHYAGSPICYITGINKICHQ